jgi:hypothetical protein
MTYIYYLEKNNIPFYVGKAKNIVRRKHKHYQTYGTDIKLCVIDECENDKEIWKFWEKHYISLFRSWGFKLENKNDGGGGPSFYTEEQKQKMKKPRKEGTGKKISKTLKGNNHSKYYTDEVKQKMSQKLKGKTKIFTKEHKDNLDKSHKKRAKKVLMYDFQGNFIKDWISKGEASKWIKENNERALKQNVMSQIKDCCMGRMISCWGYIWRYENSEIPVIPKFKIIYQFDLNKNLIQSFKSLQDLRLYLRMNKHQTNDAVLASRIKSKVNKEIIYKFENNYYSTNEKI